MKKTLFLLPFMLCASLSWGGMSAIVTSTITTAGTQEDSITVSFIVTDSIGNISSLDSVFVAIWNAGGDSTYAAKYITTAAEIDSIDLDSPGGLRAMWRWTEAIADIDGAGLLGTYTGLIIAVDTLDGTSADYLDAASFFSFQLVDDELAASLARTRFISEFMGSPCDTSLQILYPNDGSAPKDSVRVFCITNAGADTTLSRRIVFYKTGGVVDSVLSYKGL